MCNRDSGGCSFLLGFVVSWAVKRSFFMDFAFSWAVRPSCIVGFVVSWMKPFLFMEVAFSWSEIVLFWLSQVLLWPFGEGGIPLFLGKFAWLLQSLGWAPAGWTRRLRG